MQGVLSNEMIVEKIKSGKGDASDMSVLYQRNITLIRQIVSPYTAYENMEDLMQESYFGLWEAVNHYDSSKEVLFMSYAEYWIRQSIVRYLENFGSVIRISSHTKQKIRKFKKTYATLKQELLREPMEAELAEKMKLSVENLREIKSYMQKIDSLDSPVEADEELSLYDSIPSDIDVENEIIEKIYTDQCKNELWEIVSDHLEDRDSRIIVYFFRKNMSLLEIAGIEGVSYERMRVLKEQAIRKLRIRAGREIQEKFEVIDAMSYRNGIGKFRNTGGSNVEYMAIRNVEIQQKRNGLEKQYEEWRKSEDERICILRS